jgi:uncharacterized protein YecT (DUF1311 family)
MKKSAILIITLCFSLLSYSQAKVVKEIRELTPAILKSIKADVERNALKFKSALSKSDMTPVQIEFSVDTFKIEQISSKSMEVDYSTMGINNSINDLTASYDMLLNKYYQKLLKSLKIEDRKVLIETQRAWIAYRDAEAKLISLMTDDHYSGGGTIQTNIATLNYNYLVKHRAIEIYSYYESNILKD